MTRKSKRILSRILAVILAVTLVPSNMWGTASVVRAEETTEAFTEEDADVSTDDVQEPQEEIGEKETSEPSVVADEGEDSDSASVNAEEIVEDDKKPEVKKEKSETEKVSTETDNKGTIPHVHNFTTDGDKDKNNYYTITGNLSTSKGTATYNGLTLTQCLKMESATNVAFSTKNAGKLILVFASTENGKKVKVDGTNYTTASDATVTVNITSATEEKTHTITKSDGINLFYIVFEEEAGDPAASPTADPASGSTIDTGSEIKLSCSSAGTDIYYTTDADASEKDYTKYEKPIVPTTAGTLTIKAYATGGDFSKSEVVTFTYTVNMSANQLQPPTADPDGTEAVEKGTPVELKSDDTSASIYYTLDKDKELTATSGILYEEPIAIEEDNTTIRAIAVAEGKITSAEAAFTYTLKKSTIEVASDSTSIITSVEKDGEVHFLKTGGKEVYNIALSATENTSYSSDAITTNKNDDGKACSYNLKLTNKDNTNDSVSIQTGGKLKVKVPYSIVSSTANRKDEVIVLYGDTKVTEVRRDVDGILFSVKSVADPYTIIINPAPVEDDDEMAPKTYVLDAEELEPIDNLSVNTPYGTDKYFTVMCTPYIDNNEKGKQAAIVKIADVTTGSNENKVYCYTDLKWSDEILNAIGGGRTQCVRITGGAIGENQNQPVNCIKITTKLDAAKFKEANVVVYFTPKGTTSKKIIVKKDNGGKLGDDGPTCSVGTTRANVGKAEFKLTTAGTYYFGFDGEGGIIPYMEVTEVPKVPEIDMPTADPATGSELNKKSTITLNATDANIYYTTNGVDPTGTVSADEKQYNEPLAVADLPVNNNRITIKAIAIAKTGRGDGVSKVATFNYTYDPGAVSIAIDEDSKDIIKSVEALGDLSKVTRGSNTLDVTDITVKAKALESTEVDADIKAEAEKLATDTEKSNIQYYDISLILNEETEVSADTITFSEEGAGLKIKMPYSLFKTEVLGELGRNNEIFVLHNTEQIDKNKISKDRVTSQNAQDAGFSFVANSFSPYTVVVNPAEETDLGSVAITEEGGYEEGAYAEWEAVAGADGYVAYVAKAGDAAYQRIDDELIRKYDNYWRVDTVGLAKGTYYIKIDAISYNGDTTHKTATVVATETTDALKVTNYDRSGFAFSKESTFKTGSGAYNDDGTLLEDAIVLYVNNDNFNSISVTVKDSKEKDVTFTGVQEIVDESGVIKYSPNTPIDIRIIGTIDIKGFPQSSWGSSAEGLQIKSGKVNRHLTIEGIGEDAAFKDFGMLIRGCGNVELRNFAVLLCKDDSISLDTDNCNIWVHDMDLFYGQTGSAADQKKGDGTLDVKADSKYCTFSYNHFWDSGKCSLCGMKSESGPNYMTYHHNWFDHSDSRHPRIRTMTVHIYNNYYDGNSKYGVGVTTGSSAFVEANYFRNCKYPMLSSLQGSDIAGGNTGTFSGEDGGIIKAYGNHIEGAQAYRPYSSTNTVEFDAYEVTDAGTKVPATVKTKSGGTTYNNFDTDESIMYQYVADTAEIAKAKVEQYAGRLNGGDIRWTFDNATEDTNDGVIAALKAKLESYTSSVKAIGSGVPKDIEITQGDSSDVPPPSSEIAAPTASLASGIVEKGTKVTLSHENGAEIHYTTDGSAPTATSATYSGEITINETTTIRVIAVKDGKTSEVVAFKYTVLSEGSGENPNPGGEDKIKIVATYEFNPQKANMTEQTMPATDTKYGTESYFTIGNASDKAKITSTGSKPKKAPVPSKSEVSEYSVRYQFGGATATATDPKAIRFTNENKANVYVGAYLTSDVDRKLYLDTDDNMKPLSTTVAEYKFENVEAGSHGLYAKDGDVAILYVIIEEFVLEGGSGDDGEIDPPTATPASGNLNKGASVTLNAAGDIYYTMTTDGSEPANPTTADEKYQNGITITAEVGATVKIKAIAVSDGKTSAPAIFTYNIVEAGVNPNPTPTEKLSKPEAVPEPDANASYPVNVEISLTSSEGGTIYYTLDGTEPKNANDEPSETSSELAEDGTIKLDTAKTYTIKAFAVKEGYLPSDTATFIYKVSEDSTMKQLEEPTIDPASKTVGIGEKVTVKITKAASNPDDTEIYYTIDGTTPKKDAKLLYKDPFTLTVNETTTVKAIAVKDGAIPSTAASATYTVKTTTPKIGLWVELKNENEDYTYTGSAIKPDIVVGNYDNILVEGVDYTVAYKNNINASPEGTNEKKMPQITVTGKGNLTGKATTTFTIKEKSIKAEDVVVSGVEKGTPDNMLLVVENTKPAPVLYYGSVKLSKKDYDVSLTDKCTVADNDKNIDIAITGKGNFTGELNYKLKVISKNDLKKFTVAVTAPDYTYNGKSQTLLDGDLEVTDSSKTDTDGNTLTKGSDYAIVYQKDTTNAGKVKFTVVGLGYYTGAVAKTYTIKPIAKDSGFAFTNVTAGDQYPYVGTGVTIPNVGITYTDEENTVHTLVEGKDYKLTYGNNKKVGTTAKISAAFMGNYKGSKIAPVTFEITQATLTNQTPGLKIAIPDKVYNKPGVYKSVPYVSVKGVEVKASEYTVKYYTEPQKADGSFDADKEMGSKNKIDIPEGELSATVYVTITGKGKNYTSGDTPLTASYNVCRMPQSTSEGTNALDLSKAKITVYKTWDDVDDAVKAKAKENKGDKMEYTGVEIEPGVMIEIKNGRETTTLYPTDVKELRKGSNPKLTVDYVNNVNKGKATIVINGNGTDYVGSKTVTFSITTKNLKDTDVLVNLFKDISKMIQGNQ